MTPTTQLSGFQMRTILALSGRNDSQPWREGFLLSLYNAAAEAPAKYRLDCDGEAAKSQFKRGKADAMAILSVAY